MKLTAVATCRNDGYRGDLHLRVPFSINALTATFDEVIYVDWNSPSGIDLITALGDAINKTGKLRVLKVNKAQTDQVTKNDPGAPASCGLLGNNMAIRRSTGDWILITSLDSIVPDRASFEKLTADPKIGWVISRHDVDFAELKQFNAKDIEVVQRYFRENLPRYGGHGFSGACAGDVWSILDCCGDFQFFHKDVLFEIRGYEEEYFYKGYTDSNLNKKAILAGYPVKPCFDIATMHMSHPGYGFGGTGSRINDIYGCLINAGATKNAATWGASPFTLEEFTV
jgi:hypothetical protein